ncbi:MAG: hypothetical protein PHG06_00660 [Parabacteroides sp.]|nr:hypothetical protein [Parabacteroides sp.]
MIEFTPSEKEDIIKALNEIEIKVNNARKIVTEPTEIEMLDEIDKMLDKMRVKKDD